VVTGAVVEVGARSAPVVNPSHPSLCLSCKDTPSFDGSAAFVRSNPASRPVATPVAFCPCKGPREACLGRTGVAVGDQLTASPPPSVQNGRPAGIQPRRLGAQQARQFGYKRKCYDLLTTRVESGENKLNERTRRRRCTWEKQHVDFGWNALGWAAQEVSHGWR